MRALTWNIHKGIGGVDRRYRIERTISVIRHFDADMLFLQEVDQGARRSGYDHQPRMLAAKLGFKYYSANVNHWLRSSGGYGNLTLSRWPILHSFNLDITTPLKKSRGALYTEIQHPVLGPIHVFNVHLGLLHFERRAQLGKILRVSAVELREHAPTLIAGDFNDWRGKLTRAVLGKKGFKEAGKEHKGRYVATFPAFRPFFPLDRVYFKGIQDVRVVEDRPEHHARASDHRPLVVDFSTFG